MRAMQARVFSERGSQYLLVKAPPASGKSRALMFIGLDKLQNQGIRKVIVAVPERSIGASFRLQSLPRMASSVIGKSRTNGTCADRVKKEKPTNSSLSWKAMRKS